MNNETTTPEKSPTKFVAIGLVAAYVALKPFRSLVNSVLRKLFK